MKKIIILLAILLPLHFSLASIDDLILKYPISGVYSSTTSITSAIAPTSTVNSFKNQPITTTITLKYDTKTGNVIISQKDFLKVLNNNCKITKNQVICTQ